MTTVNLLPNEDRALVSTASEPLPTGGLMIAAALALAVIAVTVVVLAGNGIRDREAEVSRLNAEVTSITTQAGSLQAFATLAKATEAQAQTVRDEAGKRLAWDVALDDLARVLPAGVRFTNLSAASAGGATGTPNTGTATTATPPTVTLAGCAPSQRKVADLLSRLRDVRGASDVSLASSQADGASSTGSGASCDAGEPGFSITVTLGGWLSADAAAAASPDAAATPDAAAATPGSGA